MNMKEYGVVLNTKGDFAKVEIKRHAACGECGACQVGKDKMTMRTLARNAAGAKKGDAVAVEMAFGNVMKATGLAYGLPLIAFFIGCFSGYYLAVQWGHDPIISGFLTGIAIMVIAYLVIALMERKKVFGQNFEPIIQEIIDASLLETETKK